MLPMLIMREGLSGVEAAMRRGVRSCVSWKTRLRLSVRTRSQAEEGYVA
jgi:hypothetical protein